MPNENMTGMPNGRNAKCSAHGVDMGQNAEQPEYRTVGDFVIVKLKFHLV